MSKIFRKHQFFAGLLSVLVSVFLVTVITYAATTISSNVVTGGNLTVSGWASSTSATTTDYLYVGGDITEPAGWDFSGGDLIVSGAAYFAAKATSVTAFAVGSGTINNPDMAGGDLYVQGDVEIDGTAYFNKTTTTGATTTALYLPTIKFDPIATPTSLVAGKCFVDITDKQLNCYDGSAWHQAW